MAFAWLRAQLGIVLALLLIGGGLTVSAQSARCRDGSLSYSTSRSGTCSRHGGVAEWLSAAPKTSPAPKTAAAVPAPKGHVPVKRSAAARNAFMRQTGYPKGRPGYVVDHIIPLACGGKDEPSNMQWQTEAEAKAKDRVERRGC